MAPKNICNCGICDLQTGICCYCSDKRTDGDRIIYLDEIGEIDTKELGIKIPRDIFYCPKCKKTRISSAEMYNRILKLIKVREKLMSNLG